MSETDALAARISQLEADLKRATEERDDALAALNGSHHPEGILAREMRKRLAAERELAAARGRAEKAEAELEAFLGRNTAKALLARQQPVPPCVLDALAEAVKAHAEDDESRR